MTVYDRIIPNGAFESLIALSIGVVIALGFDFLIKSLRASFVDTASKKPTLKFQEDYLKRYLHSLQLNKDKKLVRWPERFVNSKHLENSSTLPP